MYALFIEYFFKASLQSIIKINYTHQVWGNRSQYERVFLELRSEEIQLDRSINMQEAHWYSHSSDQASLLNDTKSFTNGLKPAETTDLPS